MNKKDYSDISIDIDPTNKVYGTTNYFDDQNSVSGADLDAINFKKWSHDISSHISATGPVGSEDFYISTSNSTGASWSSPGVHIEEGADLTIGDRSLSKFMDQVEERLGILRPNEGLESRWEQLKELRRQYQELEKDLLEKEKIMNILKDNYGR